jgi:hypothetical protein
MARTQTKGTDIGDGSVCRVDLNVSASGQAVITRMLAVANSGIKITASTGIDSGTGDVTMGVDLTYLSLQYAALNHGDHGLSLHTHTFDQINNAAASYVAPNTIQRSIIKANLITDVGYISRVGIGLKRTTSGWGSALLSVGTNDAGTTFTDFEFDYLGGLSSPLGLFWNESNFNPALKANLASPIFTGIVTAPYFTATSNGYGLYFSGMTNTAKGGVFGAGNEVILGGWHNGVGRLSINTDNGNTSITGTVTGGLAGGINTLTGQFRVGQFTNGTAVIDAYGTYAYFGCNSATTGLRLDNAGAATFSGSVTAPNFSTGVYGSSLSFRTFGGNLTTDTNGVYHTPDTHASYGYAGISAFWGQLAFFASGEIATTAGVAVTPVPLLGLNGNTKVATFAGSVVASLVSIVAPVGKGNTDTYGYGVLNINTNETTNFSTLGISFCGGTTQVLRSIQFQMGEAGIVNGGNISFNPYGGTVSIGAVRGYVIANMSTLSIGDAISSRVGLLKFRSDYNAGNGAELYQSSDGTIRLNTNGSVEAMTINTAGNAWFRTNVSMGGGLSAVGVHSTSQVRVDLGSGVVGNSFILTGGYSNFQVYHGGDAHVRVFNSSGAGLIFGRSSTTQDLDVYAGTFNAPNMYAANFFGLASNSELLDNHHASQLAYNGSIRDFTLGTLITTTIDYSQAEGAPFLLEIKGNSYNSLIPFDIKVQGYIYGNTIIASAGISNGIEISGLVAINVGGQLCFWFPRQDYWQGFDVFVSNSNPGIRINQWVSTTNTAKPVSTKEHAFTIHQSWHSSNFNPATKLGVGETAAAVLNYPGRTDVVAYPVLWGLGAGSSTQAYSCAAVTIQSSTGTINATTFVGNHSWASVTDKPSRTDWDSKDSIGVVVGQLSWKNYSNGHTIFDASKGTSPSGTAVNNANAEIAWSATFPNLMGWNGANTYGLRVDSARIADSAGDANTVDGQHFGWVNADDNPTYVWGANANGTSFLSARAWLNVKSAEYSASSSKLYSTDASYCYGSVGAYYGYLTYTGARWRFQVSPASPAAVEVAYADNAGTVGGYSVYSGSVGIGADYIPIVHSSNGTMEIGMYLDFHVGAGSVSDFDVRLTASAGSLTLNDQVMYHAGNIPTWNQNTTGSSYQSRLVSCPDGSRDPSSWSPTATPNSVHFDFCGSSYCGTAGNYAGVMTFQPWTGTTPSTGDASYQLAFGGTAVNGGGVPMLRIRKGIDATWNSWYTLWHEGNFNPGNYLPLTGGTLTGSLNTTATLFVSAPGGSFNIYPYYSSTYGVILESTSTVARPMSYSASKHQFYAGNVLINSLVDDGVNKLQVTGSATVTGAIAADNANVVGINISSYMTFTTGAYHYLKSNSSGTYVYRNGANGDMVLMDTANGNGWFAGSVTAAGGGYNSQRHLKNIHVDWKGNATDVINLFAVRDFNYKTQPTHSRHLGFITDEIPECVADYVLFGEKRDAVNLYSLHALSFKAHQETFTEVELLRQRIVVLEETLKTYQNGLD